MGQIAKPTAAGATRYYWYPGDKVEWLRAGLAVLAGLLAFAVTGLLSRSILAAVTVGGSVTAVLAGANLGRRDLRAMRDFPVQALAPRTASTPGPEAPERGTRSLRVAASGEPEGGALPAAAPVQPVLPRRAVLGPAARASWRALVQGAGGCLLALIIANLGSSGLVADWVLPVVPVLLGTLAHQLGMVYERLAQEEPPELPPIPAKAAAQQAAEAAPASQSQPDPAAARPVSPAADRPARPATGSAAQPGRPTLRLANYRGQPPAEPRA
jgi:hypothetical protein